jgi:hypothetical protein
MKRKFCMLVFCALSCSAFSQKPSFVKAGGSVLYGFSKTSPLPLGIAVHAGWALRPKLSLVTGFDLHTASGVTEGYADSSTSGIPPEMLAGPVYEGPYHIQHRWLFYSLPLYMSYRLLEKQQFRVQLNAGILYAFVHDFSKGSPDVNGYYGRGTTLSIDLNLSGGLEMQYRLSDRVSLFLAGELRGGAFGFSNQSLSSRLGASWTLN